LSEVVHIRRIPRSRVKLVRVRTSHALPESQQIPAGEEFSPFYQPSPAEVHEPVAVASAVDHGEGLTRAYTSGLEEGQRLAETEFRETLERLRAEEDTRITGILTSISTQLAALQKTLERDAYLFALAVAERIIKREITLSDDTVILQIKEALQRIVGVDSIKLRVHPSDEGIVRSHRTAFLSALENVRDLIIETDDGIERGGCIIESASGNVDARIATQLRQIESALFGISRGAEELRP
jgi:flagellar assembly protein FliH